MSRLISIPGIVARNGAGSGPTLLTAAFQAGTVYKSDGVGAVKLAVTIALSGAPSISVRLMDYADPANPRQIQSVDQNDPATIPACEHVYSAPGVYSILAGLGGVIGAITAEVKSGGGVLTSGDSVSVDLVVSDGAA